MIKHAVVLPAQAQRMIKRSEAAFVTVRGWLPVEGEAGYRSFACTRVSKRAAYALVKQLTDGFLDREHNPPRGLELRYTGAQENPDSVFIG